MKNYFASVLVLVLALGISANLMADDYYVNSATGNDTTGDGSSGTPWATIRHAVNNVDDPTTATIVIHVSGDTYNLFGSTDVYDGNYDDIDIDRNFTNLTIQGAGAGITIVQAHASKDSAADRVFTIHGETDAETVTLKDMTIRNGKTTTDGGGIYNDHGTLTLTNCTVSDYSSDSDGGGILNEAGTLTLTNCTISDNSSTDNGAGIFHGGSTLTLTNCTVSGNESNYGGGILIYNGTATITNCTIANNAASNGKGGGVRLYQGDLYIKNTIIANNSASMDGDDFSSQSGTTLNSNGYNIVEDTDYGGSGTFNATGDKVGTGSPGNISDLNLSDTLEDNNTTNGTYTLKTISNSVAINTGDPANGDNNGVAIPTQDQRGANRNDDTTDIGAYEYYDDVGSLPVELSSFTATTSDGQVTLHWVTQSEVNNVGFSVYRSETKDGNYVEVAFINGAGNSAMPIDYQFTDPKVETGKTYFYYLEDIDTAGEKGESDVIKVVVSQVKVFVPPTEVVVPPAKVVPSEFRLLQNYPNPFNPETWIPYDLAKDAPVSIEIYNMRGQLVRHLDIGEQEADSYVTKDVAAYWDGRNGSGQKVASGVYWYRLQAGDFNSMRRMVILK